MNAIILLALGLVILWMAERYLGKLAAVVFFYPFNQAPSQPRVRATATIAWWLAALHQFSAVSAISTITAVTLALVWGWMPALAWLLIASTFVMSLSAAGFLWLSSTNATAHGLAIFSQVMGQSTATIMRLLLVWLLLLLLPIIGVGIAHIIAARPVVILPILLQLMTAWGIGALGALVGHKMVMPLLFTALIGFTVVVSYALVGEQLIAPAVALSTKRLAPNGLYSLQALCAYGVALVTLLSVAGPVWRLNQAFARLSVAWLALLLLTLVVAMLIANPSIVLGEYYHASGSPGAIPLIFITMSGGALSVLHFVTKINNPSASVTPQINPTAKLGFNAALVDGLLGVMVIIIISSVALEDNIGLKLSWQASLNLGAITLGFVDAAAQYLTILGLPLKWSANFIALVLVTLGLVALANGATALRQLAPPQNNHAIQTHRAHRLRLYPLMVVIVSLSLLGLYLTVGIPTEAWLISGMLSVIIVATVTSTVAVALMRLKRAYVVVLSLAALLWVGAWWSLIERIVAWFAAGVWLWVAITIMVAVLAGWASAVCGKAIVGLLRVRLAA